MARPRLKARAGRRTHVPSVAKVSGDVLLDWSVGVMLGGVQYVEPKRPHGVQQLVLFRTFLNEPFWSGASP